MTSMKIEAAAACRFDDMDCRVFLNRISPDSFFTMIPGDDQVHGRHDENREQGTDRHTARNDEPDVETTDSARPGR